MPDEDGTPWVGRLNTASVPGSPSPLWIIALFIALSEATSGVAAIATNGTTEFVFTIFTVVFPVIVFCAFVWLLIRHPANLYSPGQYTDETSIEGYVAALSRENRRTQVVLGHAIGEAVASASISSGRPQNTQNKQRVVRERVTRSFDSYLERSSITVDRSGVSPRLEPIRVPVTRETTIDELLDTIFFSLTPEIEPFSYGKTWVLATESDDFLEGLGTQWAKTEGLQRDERPIGEVGLLPGLKYYARLLD
ncbi:MAG TPA: hypothetical protein VGX26_10200 [Solirubrobacteraceae bacterium]|jgi:hypothetical protein|nr:hypothetical protein [Solirubrobacteraceae bacterium]